jgi:uncharacterized membrane protein YphA (DoxX/SURF4 family)
VVDITCGTLLARTDWCMLLGALFLLITGPGVWSLDARIAEHRGDVV